MISLTDTSLTAWSIFLFMSELFCGNFHGLDYQGCLNLGIVLVAILPAEVVGQTPQDLNKAMSSNHHHNCVEFGSTVLEGGK